ncbi:MAG: hypothetical protein JNM12_05065 [Alphaproteobacteria bacterium]|nr:hypothetical protein [Alphaproteobacteria bacterium]
MDATPDNQADGFKPGGGDAPKASFNAPASLRGVGGPNGDFWASLQQAAALKQWHKLQRLLNENKNTPIPLNPVTINVFRRAAQEGQVAIVTELFARGFSLPAEDAGDILGQLVEHHEDSMPVVGFLIRNNHAPAEKGVLAAAEKGTPLQMQQLQDAGADIDLAGRSFSAAFHAGNTAMMSYLFSKDAQIYHASIASALHRREAHPGSPVTQAVVDHYKDIVKQDAHDWELYYAYVCPNHPDMDDLRKIPFGVQEQGMTLMHLAARTGCFVDIVTAAEKDDGKYLTAADLLLQDKNGVSVLLILASRGEEKALCDVRLWHNNPGGLREVNEALKDLSAGLPIPPQMTLELQLHHLRRRADPKRWSLKPPKH